MKPETGGNYLEIVSQCENWLEEHGDNHKGVGWPKEEDAYTRYNVMLDLMRHDSREPKTVLDFGCGPSHLYDYILRNKMEHTTYSGLDISPKYLEVARSKFPEVTYYQLDVLNEHEALPTFDYIIMNGIFTMKCNLSFDAMWDYMQRVIRIVFPKARKGIAFNAMTKQVDWERDDLFHLPLDPLATFLKKEVSRHFAFRHDYGLYEYTTYVYHDPVPR